MDMHPAVQLPYSNYSGWKEAKLATAIKNFYKVLFEYLPMEKSRVSENNNIDANTRKRSTPCRMVCSKKTMGSEKKTDKS